MIVSAPASSANLGPGFDCLGMALELPFDLAVGDLPDDGWLAVEPTHPAAVAFVAAGGGSVVPLWWRSPIPPGRGLGFSGAARVAGAYLGALVADPQPGHDAAVRSARRVATELEGHADNAAASAIGGVTVVVDDLVVGLPVPDGVEVLVWWPEAATSTRQSRGALADTVSLADAAFSIGRAALWAAALAAGDLSALRTACQDRVHQPARLASRPDVAEALRVLLSSTGVLAAWLSGSGPTVAALVASSTPVDAGAAYPVDAGDAGPVGGSGPDPLAYGLPAGRTRRLTISRLGVHCIG